MKTAGLTCHARQLCYVLQKLWIYNAGLFSYSFILSQYQDLYQVFNKAENTNKLLQIGKGSRNNIHVVNFYEI